MRAGVAQVDITPPLGTPMAGYIRRAAPARAVADRLFTKALYLTDGQCAVALIVLDILLVDSRLLALVREQVSQRTGLPGHQVLVAATHTHSGPSGLGVLSFGSDHDRELLRRTVALIAESVALAMENAFPAVLKSGATIVEGFGQCRLDPTRSISERLHMLRIEDENGTLRGILANFACHPTVLNYDNVSFSADWVGAACRVARAGLGDDVVVLLSNGAAGDVHPLYVDQSSADLERLGQLLGGAIISLAGRLAATGKRLEIHNMRWGVRLQHTPQVGRQIERPALRLVEREIRLPLKQYWSTQAYDAAIHALLETLRAQGLPEVDLRSMVEHPGFTLPDSPGADTTILAQLARLSVLAGERLERDRVLSLFPDEAFQLFAVQLLQIDRDLAYFFFPGELADAIGSQLEDAGRFDELVIVGYANEYIGYLVTEADYAIGGYDVGVSHFKAAAETVFVAQVAALLAALPPSESSAARS